MKANCQLIRGENKTFTFKKYIGDDLQPLAGYEVLIEIKNSRGAVPIEFTAELNDDEDGVNWSFTSEQSQAALSGGDFVIWLTTTEGEGEDAIVSKFFFVSGYLELSEEPNE